MMEAEWTQAEAAFDSLYPHLMSITRTLAALGATVTIPRAFYAAAEFALNTRLRRALASEDVDFESARNVIADAAASKVALDVPTLEYVLRMRLERMAERFRANACDLDALAALEAAVGVARSLPLELNLWKIQNACYGLLQEVYPQFQEKAAQGDQSAAKWISLFRDLGEKLSLRVE